MAKGIYYYDYEACAGVAENIKDATTEDTESNDLVNLAKQMLDDDNITYWTNNGVNTRDVVVALSEGKKAYTTAPDGQPKETDMNPNVLKFILEAAQSGKIMVNALTDKDHSSTSNHYKGDAVDLDNNPGNTTVPLTKLNSIAKKYGGVKNNEGTHHHYDFTKRPAASGPSSGAGGPDSGEELTGSLGGVGGTGFSQSDVNKAKALNKSIYKTSGIKEGTYKSTAYGPPWNAMEGSGVTSTGIKLDGPGYGIAVDPNTLPYGEMVYVWPNPYDWKGPFLIMDTGGAFLNQGQKLDFYDWKGRAHQDAWGRKDVKVSKAEISGEAASEKGNQDPNCACQKGNSSTFSGGGDVDKFLKVLAMQESGNNPTQPGSSGGARGKYQYIDSTWRSSATTYYPPALQYATANIAPEAVQDAVTFLEYSKKFKDLDSDIFKLAVSHFYPAANSDPSLLDVIPPANVITPRQYAEKLIASTKKNGDWQKVSLKYNEAPEFSKYADKIGASSASATDSTGGTLSSDLCGTEADADSKEGSDDMKWPVDKKLWDTDKNKFMARHHTYPAVDIPMSTGTKVYSITEGKVLSAGESGACGVGVFIQYQEAVIGYCHGTVGSLKVKNGDTVRPGQQIMLSGNTGTSTGPHLHIQIKVNGQAKCPQSIFSNLAEGKSTDLTKLPSSGCFTQQKAGANNV